MSIEPGVVLGLDRDFIDVDGNRTGLVRGLLQTGGEIEAMFMGSPPWPLAPALFDGGPEWVCLGPLGLRREIVHDDFIGVGATGGETTVDGWITNTPGGLDYIPHVIDFAGAIELRSAAPDRAMMRKRVDQIDLVDDRVFWVAARLVGGYDSPIIRVGLANTGALYDTAPPASTDAAVYAQLDATGSASNLLAAVTGTSTSTTETGESYAVLPSPPTWVDVMVAPGQWAAMWVEGSGPWMVNTDVPVDVSVTPFVTVVGPGGAMAEVVIDTITVEQVSQAISPYDLSLFSAEYIADT